MHGRVGGRPGGRRPPPAPRPTDRGAVRARRGRWAPHASAATPCKRAAIAGRRGRARRPHPNGRAPRPLGLRCRRECAALRARLRAGRRPCACVGRRLADNGAAVDDDALLSLALAVHANPGAYVLLLGSGVSRAARIPTGWEVVLDLIGQVVAARGAPPPADPVAWYRETFGEEPDYARLLDRLAATPAERMTILRGYFEPSEEEREQGLKRPTRAHRAIAALARDGFVRLILTTNFDRLLERALEEAGVVPDVVSTDDAVRGMLPYLHSRCTVVKLHGDYRDPRIRNTPAELAAYAPELDALLDRVLDE